MKLFQDLKYIGDKDKFVSHNDDVWHCTSIARGFKYKDVDNTKYIIHLAYYREGKYIEYDNSSMFVLTKDELVNNFKIIS